MRENTDQQYIICKKIGWKAQYFKFADVSIFGHGCGVSQYFQFYDTNNKKINVTTSICGKLFCWVGSRNFSATMDYCISQISWNIYWSFNEWNANYKILAKFGKYNKPSKHNDTSRTKNWWFMFHIIGNYWRKHIHKTSDESKSCTQRQ